MTQPAKVQEPSMEEILASIRRIIADDEAKPADDMPVAAMAVAATPVAATPVAATSAPLPESPSPRAESPPTRIHNIAVVAPQPAAPQPLPIRGDAQSMVMDSDKKAPASSAPASGGNVAAATPAASFSPIALDEADVFDLTDEMALPSSSKPFRTVDPKDDIEFTDPPTVAERRDPPRAAPAKPRPAASHPSADDILSKQTASAVESAFNSLASTVLSANSRTLEDLVKEMMRPMLKNWLDDNLPGLVERIVKTEIERVARGR